MKIILNGTEKEFENGLTAFDAVKSLGGGPSDEGFEYYAKNLVDAIKNYM